MLPSLLIAASTLLILDNGALQVKAPTSVVVHRFRVNWETGKFALYEPNDTTATLTGLSPHR